MLVWVTMGRTGCCGCRLLERSGRRGSGIAILWGCRWVEPSRCLSIESSSACSVTSPVTSRLCLLNVPQKSWRFERPRSQSESVRSIRKRRGCASRVSDCDVGRMHLRAESNRLKLCQSSRHVNRRVAPRSDATNAAPAGQAASTSTATASLAAEHIDSPMWIVLSRCLRVGWTGLGGRHRGGGRLL